ncbi:MAG TPA: class I adenylate-forming enzyme family protein, partial [Caldimonas sp.]
MNIAQLLENAARSYPDNAAVCLGPKRILSYRQLCVNAQAVGRGLVERFGLAAGDRVAVIMTNTPEYLEVLFGIWWAGLVAVPINARLHPREVHYILESSAARVCFTNADVEPSIRTLGGTLPDLKGMLSVQQAEYRSLLQCGALERAHRSSSDPAWLF